MKSLKKRYMTLMEMLIAMALTTILLTTLTYFYREINLLSSYGERLQQQSFHTRYAENRLIQVFAKTVPEFNFKENTISNRFCFFTSGDLNGLLAPNTPSLVFMFDNETNTVGSQASVLLARLYVDKKQRLCLATWPSPETWTGQVTMKKEILLEHVSNLEFKFYMAPKKEEKPVQEAINEMDPYFLTVEQLHQTKPWMDEWQRDYNSLPPMIKLIVTQKIPVRSSKEEEILTTFAFPLPYSKKLIEYTN